MASEQREDEVTMLDERVLNTFDANSDTPGPSSTKPWNVQEYIDRIRIAVINESRDRMNLEFDLIHVEAPISNAIRRVLIAEVPTMAIEKVYLYQNTSVIQDEVLCHRLGLLPIRADPRSFEEPLEKWSSSGGGVNENGTDCDQEPDGDPKRNLIFELKIRCERNPSAPEDATAPADLYHHSSVYTSDFRWIAIGDQERTMGDQIPAMVHDDILVAKLRPGHEIEARCHCVKGIGRDHAKFSPVATATYRLLPTIRLKKDITGEAAVLLQKCFSKGVIELKPGKKAEDVVAFVADARADLCSRNVLRHEELAQNVELGRVRDHFIFSVESTGALTGAELVIEACKVLEKKCCQLRALFSEKVNG